ncbi:MAG: hypothetical protein EXS14_03115 [Planctomycetes bacterium]|nr:hypothetical protein [Planctomycetota bacterium]
MSIEASVASDTRVYPLTAAQQRADSRHGFTQVPWYHAEPRRGYQQKTMSHSLARRLRETAERNDLKAFEDLWLEMMDQHPGEIGAFIGGIDTLHAKGLMDKAATFLGLLAPKLLECNLHSEAITALRRLATLNPREKGLRSGLLTAYKALYANDERLPVLLEKSGLDSGGDIRPSVDKLENFLGFSAGRYLFHPAGWGAGRVVSVDFIEMLVVMDFEQSRGRRMNLEMAAKVTQFIENDDLRALRFDRQPEILQLVDGNPVSLIRSAVKSRGGKATLREVRDRLSPAIIPQEKWASFWNKAKVLVKAAPDLVMAPGANPQIEFSATDRGYASTCLRDLALLDSDDKRLRYLKTLLAEARNQEEGPDAVRDVAQRMVDQSKLFNRGCRISLAFLLAECKSFVPDIVIPAELVPAALCESPSKVLTAIGEIPVGGHRQAAALVLRPKLGDDWPRFCVLLIENGEPETAELGLSDLLRAGAEDSARDVMRKVTERFREHSAAFLWYLRESIGSKLPKQIPGESLIALFEKALMLHEHLTLTADKDEEKKRLARSLTSLFQSRDYEFVRSAFLSCSAEVGSNAASMLRNHRSIFGETRDQMLARMFRARPELGRMQPGGTLATSTPSNLLFDPTVLFCTEAGLLRKRQEFEDLVNRQIPENAVEIGRAASYGDLSENSEWTAAIEKQSRLTHQSEEMSGELARARVIDRNQQDGKHAALGSCVALRNENGAMETYTLLGPWEVDPGHGRISYLSDLGKAIIGKGVSESFDLENRSGKTRWTVLSIADGLA